MPYYASHTATAATWMARNFWLLVQCGPSGVSNREYGWRRPSVALPARPPLAAHGPFGQKQRDDVTFTEYGELVSDPITKGPL
jgi:hypothetical protein